MGLDALGGAEQFGGDDRAGQLDGSGCLGGAAGAEGVVVLHVGAGGEVSHAGGGSEPDEFVAHGGRGVLDDHETGHDTGFGAHERGQLALGVKDAEHVVDAALGDAREVGDTDGEGVEGEGDGHAVEAAGGDDVWDVAAGVEDERVVGDGAEFVAEACEA